MRKLFLYLFLVPFCYAIVEVAYEPDYAKGLPDRHLWKQVRDSFIKHKYREILKRHNFALTCNGCSAVYMDVSFSVGLTGSVTIHQIEAAKACGQNFPDAMRQEFLHFLKIYAYPTGLHGTSVRLRLGTGLSC